MYVYTTVWFRSFTFMDFVIFVLLRRHFSPMCPYARLFVANSYCHWHVIIVNYSIYKTIFQLGLGRIFFVRIPDIRLHSYAGYLANVQYRANYRIYSRITGIGNNLAIRYPNSFNIQYPAGYWKCPDIQPNRISGPTLISTKSIYKTGREGTLDITLVINLLPLCYLIRSHKNYVYFLKFLIYFVPTCSVQTFQQFIITYRRGNFVYNHCQ